MALENYRVIQYPEKTQLENDDYALIDSQANGTNKFQLSRIPAQASAEVAAQIATEAAAREAADQEVQDYVDGEIADVKSDLAELEEEIAHVSGLSDDAKAALLACFENVMWAGGDGSDYFVALQEALDVEPTPPVPPTPTNPFEEATYEYGSFGYNYRIYENIGCLTPTGVLLTRVRTAVPVSCTSGFFVAKPGYTVTARCLVSPAYGDVTMPSGSGSMTVTGYYDLVNVDPSSFGTNVLEGTNYVLLTFAKEDNTEEFTQEEVNNAYGTIFEYVDAENVFDAAEYGFGGWAFSAGVATSTGYQVVRNELTNRAGSLIAIGCESGQLVSKSGYKVNIHYLTSNKTEQVGSQDAYVDALYSSSSYYQWEDSKTIPSGTKYCCVSVKKDSNEDFTQSEIENLYGTAFEYQEVS